MLVDIQEKLDLGAQIGISFRIDEVKTTVVGNIAWAIYSYTAKIGAGGQALSAEKGVTTAILSKNETGWIIQHEHSSVIEESESVAQTESSAPPRKSPGTASVTSLQPRKIVTGSFTVPAAKFSEAKFTLTKESRLTGQFQASGGAGNDIQAFILDEAAYANWRKGGQVEAWYNSGTQTTGDIDVSLMAGAYYIIFSNVFSVITPKTITASILAR